MVDQISVLIKVYRVTDSIHTIRWLTMLLVLSFTLIRTMTQTNIPPLGSAYFGNSSTLSFSTDFHQSRKVFINKSKIART